MQQTAILSIFKLAQAYYFHFLQPEPQYSAAALVAVLPDADIINQNLHGQLTGITRLLNQIASSNRNQQSRKIHTKDPFFSLGRLLYNQLLPAPIQQALQALPAGAPLLIATDAPELPWELAHDGENYLALKFNLGRQLLTNQPLRNTYARKKTGWSALLIGNPTDDLPETLHEIEQVAELIALVPGATPPQILVRSRATKERILQEIAGGQYDLIHYSGHAIFDSQQPAKRGLILANGQILTADEIIGNLGGQPLVFLNGCESSRGVSHSETLGGLAYLNSAAQGLAAAFVQGGARGVIGTFWPILDSGSRQFALDFYRQGLRGDQIGTTLRMTRAKVRQNSDVDPIWASYTLYGHPQHYLVQSIRHEVRLITVVAVQIPTLPAIYEHLGLETAAEIEMSLQDRLTEIAHRFDGEINTTQSSIIFIYFGLRRAHEDNGIRAVQTALNIHQVVTEFVQHAENRPSYPFHIQIGITTGQIICRRHQTDQGIALKPTGNMTERASLLAGCVVVGAIWIDETTERLVRDVFACQTVDEQTELTTANFRTIYQVLHQQGQARLPSALEAHLLVGREQELAQLKQWRNEAMLGQGQIVGLMGAPGVGKTHLLQALLADTINDSNTWINGFCHSFDQERPYALLEQIICGLADITHADSIDLRRTKLSALIAAANHALQTNDTKTVQHEILALLGKTINLPSDTVSMLEPELQQRRLVGILQVLLRYKAQQHFFVLTVEDLHAIDEASWSVLAPLAGAISHMRVLLIVTYRPDWSHNWIQHRHYRHLPLDVLPEDTGRQLLAELLGAELSRELADTILQQAGGNPLFITEIVQALRERELLVKEEAGWRLTTPLTNIGLPETVELLIQSRVDRLAPDSREVLQRAAVIGTQFEHELLVQVQDEEVRKELGQRIDELTRRDFLQTIFGFSMAYIFSHSVIQQTIYEKLLEQLRRALHGLVARSLHDLYGDQVADQLAYHYYRSNDTLNAIRYSLIAAQRAAETWANQTALTWYSRALEILQSFETNSSVAIEHPQEITEQLIQWRVEALAGKAEVQNAIGENGAAVTGYTQALQILSESSTFSADYQASLHRKLAIAYHNQGELDQAWRVLDKGLAILGEDSSLELGRLHIWRGMIQVRRGEFADGLTSYGRAIVHVGNGAIIEDLSKGYNLVGIIYRRIGRWSDAIEVLKKNIEQCQTANYLPGLARAQSNLGCVYQDLGQWDETLACAQDSIKLSKRTGDIRRQAAAAIDKGEIYRRRGQMDLAIAAYQEAYTIGVQFELPEIAGMAQLNLSSVYMQQSDLLKAESTLVAGEQLLQHKGIQLYDVERLRLRAQFLLQQEQLLDALHVAQSALTYAQDRSEQLEVGIVNRILGKIHLGLEEYNHAKEYLEASLTVLRQQHSHHEIGLTLVTLTALYTAIAAGSVISRQDALAYCDEAIAIFAQLKAVLDLQYAETLRAKLVRANSINQQAK